MGEHSELMQDMGMSRNEYLRAIRKEQPMGELKRKARKAKRRGNANITQEEIDYEIAQGVLAVSKLLI